MDVRSECTVGLARTSSWARQQLELVVSVLEQPDVSPRAALDGQYVNSLLKARSRRNQFFNPVLFSDPGWDILLQLYRAELEQHRTSVTGLAAIAHVPQTTALRWLRVLEDEGLLVRRADPLDRRRVFIDLTPSGFDKLTSYFDSLPLDVMPI